jgi:CRISPR-associated exonuclease Cas4
MAFVADQDDTEWVMISALEHYAYCTRQCALIHIEQVWEDNLFTAEGSLMHDKADLEGTTESRGDLRIARGLRLHSRRLGLTGKADVVEFHRVKDDAAPPDGALSPAVTLTGVTGLWTPFPVEYKRGHLRHEEGFEIQLCAQALCLEEMMNVRVPAGALFYGKTARRLDIAFDSALREKTETTVERLHALLLEGKTPTAPYEKKCDKCSLLSLCMPKATGSRKSVQRYLESAIISEISG